MNRAMIRGLTILLSLLNAGMAAAQGTAADYERAAVMKGDTAQKQGDQTLRTA